MYKERLLQSFSSVIAGKHFDRKIVQKCFSTSKEFPAEKEREERENER
jgi:hypothetical protein